MTRFGGKFGKGPAARDFEQDSALAEHGHQSGASLPRAFFSLLMLKVLTRGQSATRVLAEWQPVGAAGLKFRQSQHVPTIGAKNPAC